MRISGNYLDRLRYNIIPMAILFGIIGGIFSNDKLQGFLVFGGIALGITWLIDSAFIFRKFGSHLNKLVLAEGILFNGTEIQASQIITIKTENIYTDSIIAKWSITTIRLTLDDNSDFYILAKPHSIFFYIKYLAGILKDYYGDRKRYKTGVQRGFVPLSGYFVRETSQTLDRLISEYPELKLKIY